MRLVYQWLGAEIVFVHVGHGLLGAGVVAILALNLPWTFTLALTPIVLFSLWGWFREASLAMPVARRYLSGDPFPAGNAAKTPAKTTKPNDAGPTNADGASGHTEAN